MPPYASRGAGTTGVLAALAVAFSSSAGCIPRGGDSASVTPAERAEATAGTDRMNGTPRATGAAAADARGLAGDGSEDQATPVEAGDAAPTGNEAVLDGAADSPSPGEPSHPAESGRAPGEVEDDAATAPDEISPDAPPRPDAAPRIPDFGAVRRARELVEDARGHYEAGRTEAALAALSEARATSDGLAAAWVLASRILREERRLDEALEVVEAGRERHPRFWGLVREEQAVLEARDETQKAIERLRATARTPGQHREAAFRTARLQALQGEDEKALESLQHAASLGFSGPDLLEDPAFDTVRSTEAFDAARKRIVDNRRAAQARLRRARNASTRYEVPEPSSRAELVEELEFRMARKDSHHLTAELEDLGGRPFRPEELGGHHQVICVWAHWSAACGKIVPALERIQERYRDRGLRVWLVATDLYGEGESFANTTGEWLDRRGIALRSAAIDARQGIRLFQARRVPKTFFLGPGNRSYLAARGPLPEPTIDALVQRLLDEAPGAEEASAPRDEAAEGDSASPAPEAVPSSDEEETPPPDGEEG